MSTRKLIIAAMLTLVAIVLASGIQFFLIARNN